MSERIRSLLRRTLAFVAYLIIVSAWGVLATVALARAISEAY